jgi:hypothetical protein
MFFQKVLKGINNLDRTTAESIINGNGIICNWWRNAGYVTNAQVKGQLTDSNLVHHLNHYDTLLPNAHPLKKIGNTYGAVSPFISTTAGAIQRDAFLRRNFLFHPFITALRFATNNFTSSGFIFYAYVITIGKKSIVFEQFSEEVRELHIYQQYLPFHHEGEIVAKISIPSTQIEKAEEYDGIAALADLRQRKKPAPIGKVINNPHYAKPDNYSNIREIL